jgi:aldose 1-epimerase
MMTPDSKGAKSDVLLGFSSFAPYASAHPYFGATVGRFANRIGSARFSLSGKEYTLWANNGPNHLHGGRIGFNRKLWSAEAGSVAGMDSIRFSLESPDGDEGYPGMLKAAVTVSLSGDGELTLRYEADSDRPTPVNLTNHAYFNLSGEGKGTILGHKLTLRCSRYLPVDATLIPLPGAPREVSGTAFDFRNPKLIGADLGSSLGGYDHCFVIDHPSEREPFAVVEDGSSDRTMAVSTTLPAVQFYTGNNLNGIMGKGSSVYGVHSALCLETECYPDSPNRQDFPSCIVEPGKRLESVTKYRFSSL